jgi:hypothetical protein
MAIFKLTHRLPRVAPSTPSLPRLPVSFLRSPTLLSSIAYPDYFPSKRSMATDAASRHDINALFKDFEHRFPVTWREDRWYLTLVSLFLSLLVRSLPYDRHALLKRKGWSSDREWETFPCRRPLQVFDCAASIHDSSAAAAPGSPHARGHDKMHNPQRNTNSFPSPSLGY